MNDTIPDSTTGQGAPRLRTTVQQAVLAELADAQDRFGAFNSAHEGYAVMLEESDELSDDETELAEAMQRLWQAVKVNDVEGSRSTAQHVVLRATTAACEAIQLAAMAERFLVDVRDES